MNYRFSLLFLSFCLLAIQCLTGQSEQYHSYKLSPKDGFSGHTFTCLVEDQQGFIWIGTYNGLNRYDGKEIKIFNTLNSNLSFNKINKGLLDPNGLIWLVAVVQEGVLIDIFDPFTTQVEQFGQKFPNCPFRLTEIKHIKGDEFDRLWILLNTGELYMYEGSFQKVSGLGQKVEADFFITDKLSVWYAHDSILVQQDLSGNRIQQLPKPFQLIRLRTDTFGRLWAASTQEEGLGEIKKYESGKWHDLAVEGHVLAIHTIKKQKTLFDIWLDGQNNLWVSSFNKLLLLDTDGSVINDFNAHVGRREANLKMPHFYLEVDMTDNGFIWLTALSEITVLYPAQKIVRNYLNDGISTRSLIELENNKLLAFTYNGPFVIDRNEETISKFDIWSDNTFRAAYLIDSSIWGLLHHNRLYKYDFKSQKEYTIQLLNEGADEALNLNHLIESSDSNTIWVASEYGIQIIDKKDLSVRYPSAWTNDHPLNYIESQFLYENKHGIWVATVKGVYLLDSKGAVLYQVPFFNAQINTIYEDHAGFLWLGTKGKGLYRWKPFSHTYEDYTIEDGLCDNTIYTILEDDAGNIWMGTNNGLSCLEVEHQRFRNFFKEDGISHNEFNKNSVLKSSDGYMYFGGLNGYNAFRPDELLSLPAKATPPRIIRFLVISDRDEEPTDRISELNLAQQWVVPADVRSIQFEFSQLDYRKDVQSKFAYFIEGYDTKWNYLSGNELRLNKLPFGDYQLQVKGKGYFGQWSEPLILPLKVTPPFYYGWLFITGCIIFLLGITYLIVCWRNWQLQKDKDRLEAEVLRHTKSLARQKEQLEQINQIKDQLFAIIAHDLRGPAFTLQGIQQKIDYLKTTKQTDRLEELTSIISDAVNSLVSRLENLLFWSLGQTKRLPVVFEEISLKDLIDQQLKKKALATNTPLKAAISKDLVVKVDSNSMNAVISNLLDNAIKFTKTDGNIRIEGHRENEHIKLFIKDTGIGMDKEQLENLFLLKADKSRRGIKGEKGMGIGLVLCKELVEINGGEMKVKSQQGLGTQVELIFPSCN